jgi:hypothetical protein
MDPFRNVTVGPLPLDVWNVAPLEERPSSTAKQASLAEDLEAAGADRDPEILRLAQALVEAIEREAPQAAASSGVDQAALSAGDRAAWEAAIVSCQPDHIGRDADHPPGGGGGQGGLAGRPPAELPAVAAGAGEVAAVRLGGGPAGG